MCKYCHMTLHVDMILLLYNNQADPAAVLHGTEVSPSMRNDLHLSEVSRTNILTPAEMIFEYVEALTA